MRKRLGSIAVTIIVILSVLSGFYLATGATFDPLEKPTIWWADAVIGPLFGWAIDNGVDALTAVLSAVAEFISDAFRGA